MILHTHERFLVAQHRLGEPGVLASVEHRFAARTRASVGLDNESLLSQRFLGILSAIGGEVSRSTARAPILGRSQINAPWSIGSPSTGGGDRDQAIAPHP